MENKKELYKKKGQAAGAVYAIITLIVGVAVAILVMTFTGALSGQTYNLVEADIDNINDTDIQASIKAGIGSGFTALEQTGAYLPIIVLAVVISVVLALVLSFTAFGGMMGGGRQAL